jgi:hypothetical protein
MMGYADVIVQTTRGRWQWTQILSEVAYYSKHRRHPDVVLILTPAANTLEGALRRALRYATEHTL